LHLFKTSEPSFVQKYIVDKIVEFQLKVMEDNNGNYLSAGEMPIPTLFFGLCVVYLGVAIFWMVVLRKAKYVVLFFIKNLQRLI